ncbi:hypothetical protein N9Y31_02600 [Alphaproteobacteria bacterium]|nr:hypothetical protein [Alphaproteobacteria bacterium]
MSDVILTGFSTELLNLAPALGINIIAVVDPKKPKQLPTDVKFFASDKAALDHLTPSGVLNGIDHIPAKVRVDLVYAEYGIHPVSLIAGTICKTSHYGAGLLMQVGSIVTSDVSIGRCVKINTCASITHDVIIGDYSIVAPGAVILGRVVIGNKVYVGANSTILPDVVVGDGAVIGAGTVITKDVHPGDVMVGSPARAIKK